MVNLAHVKGLLFDLDGLIVDSEPIWFQVEGGFLAELGHVWSYEDAEACMGQGTPNTLRIWHERFGVRIDIERDTETIIDRMVQRAPDMPLKNGVLRLLEIGRCRSLPMAVASSSRRRLIEAVLEAKGIRHYFTHVVSGQDVPQGKPAPDIFLRAATLIGVAPAHCLVLEDALAGVRAGVAAGAQVAAVPTADIDAIRLVAHGVYACLDTLADQFESHRDV